MMSNMDINRFFAFPKSTGLPDPLSIDMAGKEFCSLNYHIKRQHSLISVLCYVVSGTGSILINNQIFHATSDSVFIIPKGSDHEYFVGEEDPWSLLWFNINGDLFSSMTAQYELDHQVLFPNSGEGIHNLFKQALWACEEPPSSVDLQQRLSLFVIEILMELSKKHSSLTETYSPSCMLIKNYLDEQLKSQSIKSFSLVKMSHDLFLSSRQLSRIFNQELGYSPYDYFMKEKAKLAEKYLQNTTMSIKEISYELGFCDQYYFSNFFKQRYGISPHAFRNNHTR